MHCRSFHDLLCVTGADMRHWYADQQEDQEHADVQAACSGLQTGVFLCSLLCTVVCEVVAMLNLNPKIDCPLHLQRLQSSIAPMYY